MAANVGLGYRTFSQQRIYGINLYYDYRNAPNISYNQLGAGIEALGKEWDFRLNGYFPVSRKIARSSGPFFVEFAGNSLFLAQDYDFAMKGADAEVGYHFGKSRLLDFYAAGGPYYYLGHIGTSTLGVKARVAGMFKDYVTLEVSTISHCQNLPTNAASGISIEQYTNLTGTVMNNTLSDNTGTTFVISSTLTAPTVCVTLTGNSNTSDYVLINPVDGVYRLSPCDAETLNTGTINKVGTIDSVQSCASLQLCSTDGCCGP